MPTLAHIILIVYDEHHTFPKGFAADWCVIVTAEQSEFNLFIKDPCVFFAPFLTIGITRILNWILFPSLGFTGSLCYRKFTVFREKKLFIFYLNLSYPPMSPIIEYTSITSILQWFSLPLSPVPTLIFFFLGGAGFYIKAIVI